MDDKFGDVQAGDTIYTMRNGRVRAMTATRTTKTLIVVEFTGLGNSKHEYRFKKSDGEEYGGIFLNRSCMLTKEQYKECRTRKVKRHIGDVHAARKKLVESIKEMDDVLRGYDKELKNIEEE